MATQASMQSQSTTQASKRFHGYRFTRSTLSANTAQAPADRASSGTRFPRNGGVAWCSPLGAAKQMNANGGHARLAHENDQLIDEPRREAVQRDCAREHEWRNVGPHQASRILNTGKSDAMVSNAATGSD